MASEPVWRNMIHSGANMLSMEQNTPEPNPPSELTSDVARRVRQVRLQRGLSARELAERCAAAGQPSLSRSTIAKIEAGARRFITLDEIAALAHALQILVPDLITPADPQTAPGASREPAPPAAPADSVSLALTAELRVLRAGPGIQAGNLRQQLGPLLTELVSGTPAPGLAPARSALADELTTCCSRLAADLRDAIFASLALSTPTREMTSFKDRAAWLATRLDCEYRTALRRIDTAERQLAGEITRELRRRRGQPPANPDGWYLDELRTLVRLDTPTPEAHENRRIIATRPGLTEVTAWMDVPPAPGTSPVALSVEVLYGGQLQRKEQPSNSRFHFVIRLPAPLHPGDAHEYGLILRVPAGERMKPCYIFSPECPCNVFDLRVRFSPTDRPAWIRRVDGETVRMLDAAEPAGNPADLDEASEIHLRFRNPTTYLCYGLQWQHHQPGTGLEAHG